MPQQSRGFWHCSHCGAVFDLQEQAQTHEAVECEVVKSQEAPNTKMPPYTAASPAGSQCYVSDYFTTNHAGTHWRRPLKESSQSDGLCEPDAAACASVELVDNQTGVFMQGKQECGVGRVYLECCHCRTPVGVPRSVDSLAVDVRNVALHHLAACDATPLNIQRLFCDPLPTNETSWQNDANTLRSLTNFCSKRCGELGMRTARPDGLVLWWSSTERTWENKDKDADLPLPFHQKHDQIADSRNEVSGRSHSAFTSPERASLEPVPLDAIGRASPPPPSYAHAVPVSENAFPFYQDANGDWLCKYCCHLPVGYRDQHFVWPAQQRTPPAANFIEYHLSICREYARANYALYQGGMQYAHFHESVGYPVAPQQYATWETRPADASHNQTSLGSYQDSSAPSYSQSNHRSTENSFSAQNLPEAQPRLQLPQRAVQSLDTTGDRDKATKKSMDYLARNDQSNVDSDGVLLPEKFKLVLEEDRLLLTDYFFYLMKQLRLVRFSEADRRTRGGKRENIVVGFGGLLCVHCANATNARKFFWRDVDRLANSFAEIPAHILKCRRCPQETKDALLELKRRHPAQMSRLPRGSQKVFFRRMWHRVHDGDPKELSTPESSPLHETSQEPEVDTQRSALVESASPPDLSPDRSTGTTESVVLMERSANEAAQALSDSLSQQQCQQPPSSRVLLAVPEDKEWLSDTDCFVRKQIEVFCATVEDVEAAQSDHKYSIQKGQVGLRCIHCAISNCARLNAVAYPFTINGMYESVREFQRLHLEDCNNTPPSVRANLSSLKGASSLSSVLRKYYVLSARALGLFDTNDGIRAGGNPVPFGPQSGFSFSDDSSTGGDAAGRTGVQPSMELIGREFNVEAKRKIDHQQSPGGAQKKREVV